MSTAIVGCGGIGLLLASSLIASGEDVYLLDRTEDRARQLSKITLHRGDQTDTYPVWATADPQKIPPVEWIILAVKAYDTQSAAEQISTLAQTVRATLVMQNGLPQFDALSKFLPRWLVGVTYQGSTRKHPGVIVHAGEGKTVVGLPKQARRVDRKTCSDLVALLQKAGWTTEESLHIEGEIWSKILINSAINPLTAILKVPNGKLAQSHDAKEIIEIILQEGMCVVQAQGIVLPIQNPLERVLNVCVATAQNQSSMLQDLYAKKKTEIDALNGAIVAYGKRYNIPTPVNEMMVHLTHLFFEITRSNGL